MKRKQAARGFTLIELLVGMAIFMIIMALTFAVWNKAQHSVARTLTILDLHYRAHTAGRMLDLSLQTSSPLFHMSIDNAPTNHGNMWNNPNVNFSGTIAGAFRVGSSLSSKYPLKDLTAPGKRKNPCDGTTEPADALWGHYQWRPKYDYTHTDGTVFRVDVPLDSSGNVVSPFSVSVTSIDGVMEAVATAGGSIDYCATQDPRGYPYTSYGPICPDTGETIGKAPYGGEVEIESSTKVTQVGRGIYSIRFLKENVNTSNDKIYWFRNEYDGSEPSPILSALEFHRRYSRFDNEGWNLSPFGVEPLSDEKYYFTRDDIEVRDFKRYLQVEGVAEYEISCDNLKPDGTTGMGNNTDFHLRRVHAYNKSSWRGDVPRNQPRWVRVTFRMMDAEDKRKLDQIRAAGLEDDVSFTPVVQTFDHWVWIR